MDVWATVGLVCMQPKMSVEEEIFLSNILVRPLLDINLQVPDVGNFSELPYFYIAIM